VRRSAAGPYALACAAGVVLFPFVGTVPRVLVYDAVAALAVAAMAFGIRDNRPERRRAWLLLLAGVAAWVLGDLIGSGEILAGRFAPLGGVPGAFYVLGYPLLGAGLVGIGRGVERRRAVRLALDTLTLVLLLWLVLWHSGFEPILNSDIWSPTAYVLAFAYPVGDLVLLGAAAWIAFAGARGPSTLALVAGLATMLSGDLLHGTGSSGTATGGDVTWLAAYALLGFAALHPSMRETAPWHGARLTTRARRWLFYGAAMAALPVVFLLQWFVLGRIENVRLLIVLALVVRVSLVARLALFFTDLDRARVQAETSERKFRMVFDGAPIGLSIGKSGMMTETNAAFQQMLGYSAEELAARHFLDVTHPADSDLEEQRAFDLGSRSSFAVDKRYVRKDGSVVDARVRVASGVHDDLDLGIVEDVTERRALEAELREAQRLDSVAALAGGVAHDFNNLMLAVGGYADLLLRELKDEAPRRKVAAIRDAAARASDLTRQLLAFGRQQVLDVRELDLREVASRAPSLLRPLLPRDVLLETAAPLDPVPVVADPAQLDQVLLSLAANACDAMPTGGVLSLSVRADGNAAVLAVADTGRGMTDEVREQIFEPFFSTRGLGEAPGLGLATVHGIVHQSGGSIEAASSPGQGSVFTIRLPLALPVELAPATID
jgi:PAS domain S-box-containing protein